MKNKLRKSRRKRPTLEDTYNFIKKGASSSNNKNNSISLDERKKRIEKLSHELKLKIKTHIPRSKNLELVILKCHLLVEYVFEEFIDLMAPIEGIIKNNDTRFSFKQKEVLVHMLDFPDDPVFFPSADLLNQIRNKIAHSLEINRNKIDELIKINSEDPEHVKIIDDTARIKAIKNITSYMCGLVLGVIEGAHSVSYSQK